VSFSSRISRYRRDDLLCKSVSHMLIEMRERLGWMGGSERLKGKKEMVSRSKLRSISASFLVQIPQRTIQPPTTNTLAF